MLYVKTFVPQRYKVRTLFSSVITDSQCVKEIVLPDIELVLTVFMRFSLWVCLSK